MILSFLKLHLLEIYARTPFTAKAQAVEKNINAL